MSVIPGIPGTPPCLMGEAARGITPEGILIFPIKFPEEDDVVIAAAALLFDGKKLPLLPLLPLWLVKIADFAVGLLVGTLEDERGEKLLEIEPLDVARTLLLSDNCCRSGDV